MLCLYIHGIQHFISVVYISCFSIGSWGRGGRKTQARSKGVVKYLSFFCHTLEQLDQTDV